MRSLRILCLLLFASLPRITPSAQTLQTIPPTDKESATVAGQVLRLDTGEPLKKARVTLESHLDEGFAVFYLTDEQGHFVFENVPPGSYDLQVSRSGYVDAEYGQRRLGAPGAVLTLAPGQRMTELVFKLAHTAAISGHVFDEDGEPIAKATVLAYRAAWRSGKERESEDDPILTNDQGEFRIFGLAPGRYYVAVNYRQEVPFRRDVPSPNQKLSTGYPPSYYPNTVDPAKAQAITVRAGDEMRPVDFFLRPTRFVTVRGRVICSVPGSSVASGRVSLNPQGPGLAQALQGISDNFRVKDPKFELRNVPPGSYDLTASYQTGESNDWHIARRQLEVGNSDVDGVTITVSRGVDISGHVIWESTPANIPGSLHVRLQSVGEDHPYISEPAVKPDGSFQFRGVPEGSYRPLLRLHDLTENAFLKSARYGSATVIDAGFTIQPGSDVSLELTLSSRVAQLTGRVTNGDSRPAVGATVVLIPDRRGLVERFKWTTTDQDGRFTMAGLAPGDYKVFSWDSVDESEEDYDAEWFDPEWLKPYETKGESIHLEESDRKSVHLEVIELDFGSP